MTVIPMLGIAFIRVKPKDEEAKPGLFDRLGLAYRRFLESVLKRSWLFMLLIVGFRVVGGSGKQSCLVDLLPLFVVGWFYVLFGFGAPRHGTG